MTTAILFYCLLAVALAADTVTTQIHNQIKAAFDLIDTNQDGHISLTELYQIYDKYDTDDDGHMTLAEYMTGTSIPKDQATPNFNSYDLNKDGDVSRSEVKPIFDQFDANGNGEITLGEFEHHFIEIQKAMQAGVGK